MAWINKNGDNVLSERNCDNDVDDDDDDDEDDNNRRIYHTERTSE